MTGGCSLGVAFTQDDAEAQRSTQAKQDDTPEGLKKRRALDVQKLQYTKVGSDVSYSKGSGTIVSKDGMYVTIFNKDAEAYDEVHVGETYLPGDTISMGIMNQLWDRMALEVKQDLLRKAMVAEVEHFDHRTWLEIPSNLQEAIKANSNKSDVEHNALGGVTTDTPIEAPKDYEEDHREGDRKQLRHEYQEPDGPKDAKEGAEEIRIGFQAKAEQDMTAITGEGDEKKDKAEQDMTAITGEPDKVEKEGGGLATATAGSFNATYDKQRKLKNKFNTRWGPRQVTEEEGLKFINK